MSDPIFDWLGSEARAREKLHAGQASSRPLSDNYELVGLAGEAEFARHFRQPLDLERRVDGDKGVDFIVPLGFTVDVKTSRNAIHLLVEIEKVDADIYVLAEYSDLLRQASLVGWEYGSTVARAPTKIFVERGPVCHFIHRDVLRPINDLGRRVMRLSFGGKQ